MSRLGRLPSLIMASGFGVLAAAVGAEVAGWGAGGLGARQLLLAVAGLSCFLVGAVLDSATGGHSLRNWRSNLFDEDFSLYAFVGIVAQLVMLLLVIRQYELHNQAFFLVVMPLTVYGFVLHSLVPPWLRLPFFIFLSVTAIASVLGLANAAWLIGIGLALIGLCHLPISFATRIAAIVVFSSSLAVLRAGWVQSPWPAVIWPVLGSMFMFRLIVYLYDLRHEKGAHDVTHALAYFFLLPNVIFTLFPVVDFETFCHTYSNRGRAPICREGVHWIFRGVTHLLLYRLVNYYIALPIDEVVDAGSLLTFLVANYLLYLRVSGQFHIAVGILKLFGFNLPQTNHFYYLASSFTDFWRRINIYWKDFMMKVFYYPVYFYTRRWGSTIGLVLSTMVVFVATWFLHSYQWFWLRGSFPLTMNDSLFWGVLAILVLGNVVYEMKYRKAKIVAAKDMNLRQFLGLCLRTLGTFSTICVLWALWSANSVDEWLELFAVVNPGTRQVNQLLLSSAGAVVVVAALFMVFRAIRPDRWLEPGRAYMSAVTFASLTALFVLGTPAVVPLLGGSAGEVVRDLRVSRLGRRDAALMQRGYYEDLLGVNRFNSELWEVFMKRPDSWVPMVETEAGRLTGDFMLTEHVPEARITFHGAPYSINRFGMRDRDYEELPPDGVYRMGVLGSSVVVGWGVGDDETFESILERQLNDQPGGGEYERYELLNFAVGGHCALQEMHIFETKALSFGLSAILYFAHPDGAIAGDGEGDRAVHMLGRLAEERIDIPHEFLRDLLRDAGVRPGMGGIEANERLIGHRDAVLSWTYSQIVTEAEQRSILPIWVLLPIHPSVKAPENEVARLISLAQEAGFVVVDLSTVFDGVDSSSLVVAEWDHHPNARGHALIADALYQVLRELGETPLFPSIPSMGSREMQ